MYKLHLRPQFVYTGGRGWQGAVWAEGPLLARVPLPVCTPRPCSVYRMHPARVHPDCTPRPCPVCRVQDEVMSQIRASGSVAALLEKMRLRSGEVPPREAAGLLVQQFLEGRGAAGVC